MKPRETTILDLSKSMAGVKGVEEVDITVTEVDVKTETIKLTIRGSAVDYDAVLKVMSEHGAIVRSLDEINVAKTKPLSATK